MTFGSGAAAPTIAGEIRVPGGPAAPGTITLGPDAFVLAAAGAQERTVAYRDLSIIAINAGVAMLVAGDGPDAERWLLGNGHEPLAVGREIVCLDG